MAGTSLGTAYVQIVPQAHGISGAISNLLSPAAASAGTSAGSKIGAFAKKAIVAAGIGAALTKVVQASMAEGGKLQQSYFGGLDTLYGEAADAARNYAKEAAKAGISMNTYSEQAVSFGAALKSAYGGDVVKAAEAANTAILDMADNSAKMGTDISMIQNAYQGFAKQNYTMLDNLKLGYGGTKTEMERLLADAEKLSGQEYDISNLGDVYEAIHVIQGELGLTGVAAAEAEGTFTGSFGSMRAAAQNFLGELALGMDVSESLNVLVVSANTFFFNNFLPMLGNIMKALPGAIITFIRQGVPVVLSSAASLLSNIATSLAASANSLTGEKVFEWATTTLPKVVSAAGQVIGKFASALLSNLPKIVVAVGRIGLAIVTGLGSAIWGKVTAAANGIRDRFMKPINAMRDKVKGVIDKIKGYFPFNLGKILHFSLPKISVSGGKAPWGIGGAGTRPSFSVSWQQHAEGGIFARRTVMAEGNAVHEFNERGTEAIVPLDPFWAKMDRMTEALLKKDNPQINVNVYASEKQDANEIADIAIRKLTKTVKRERLAWQ